MKLPILAGRAMCASGPTLKLTIGLPMRLAVSLCMSMASAFLFGQTASPAIDPAGYKFLLGYCKGTEDYRTVYGVVGPQIDLSDEPTATAVLNLAADYTRQECPRPSTTNMAVYLFRGDPKTFTQSKFDYKILGVRPMIDAVSAAYGIGVKYGYGGQAVSARLYPGRWNEYQNFERERKIVAANEAAQKKHQEEQLAQEKAKAEQFAENQRFNTDNLYAAAGTKQSLGLSTVCQNPFPHVGKKVIFVLVGWGWRATSPTSALMTSFMGRGCPILMSGVPSAVLNRSFDGPKILVLKILGMNRGTLNAQYAFHEMCLMGDCGEFTGLQR